MNQPALHQPVPSESLGQRAIASVLRSLLRAALGRTFRAGLPFEQQRRRLRAVARLTLPPRRATFTPADAGGVPGEWVQLRRPEQPALHILYLHGGGYCVGAPATHRAVTGHLAARCAARVFAADYRLAPEHPFPAAVDDAATAYRGLLAAGIPAGDIVIAGDSAGGGLAVAAALRARELEQPLPRALVLFSPWADLSLARLPSAPSGEVMLNRPWIAECARVYLARGNPAHPLVSPIGARLEGLPPTLIQVGTDELLLDDSRRLHERLLAAGVSARLEEYPRRWHVFQANAGVLADADRALDAAAGFIAGVAPNRRG